MFVYPTFEVEIVRKVDVGQLDWPAPGDSDDDSGLGCNRMYTDLRRLSWGEARRVHALEGELMARVESARNAEEEVSTIEDELYESDSHLYGLDLGVASTVISLSAARCVPFSSCNAGTFCGHHQEVYPLVAFFAKAPMIDLLLRAATEAEIGMGNHLFGCLVAYADDVRKVRGFAERLIAMRSLFQGLRARKISRREESVGTVIAQGKFPFV
jgi:hypothetical protein